MSQYADYDNVSKNYDTGRQPVASDVLMALAQLHSGKQIQNMNGLDAGCGTGNYAKAFLDRGVGELTLLDASAGMLNKARDKIAQAQSRGQVKDVIQSKLPDLPFGNEEFDFVMFNQVLHHLVKDPDGMFPEIEKAFREAHRVLKPSAILLITTVLPIQSKKACWYCHLIPEAACRCAKLFPDCAFYRNVFQRTGFKCHIIMNVLGKDFFKDYDNVEGPLDKTWRDNDSVWCKATGEELETALRMVRELKNSGKLQQWKDNHDFVDTLGSIAVICAQKL